MTAAVQAQDPGAAAPAPCPTASPSRCAFRVIVRLLYRSVPSSLRLLYSRRRRGHRLCVPAADAALSAQVMHELPAKPMGWHFGHDKTLALARRSVWWPGQPAAVEKYVHTCPTCQRVEAADHLPPAGLLFLLQVPTRQKHASAWPVEFLELPVARSGHGLLQVRTNLLTERVSL